MDHREELLQVFHIGPEDLEANRAGLLSDGQARRLVRSGYWNLSASVGIGVVLAAVLYGVAEKPLVPIQWILTSVLIAAALCVGIVYSRQTRAAAAEGRVECLTGPVQLRMRWRAGWYLVIAGRSFSLPVHFWHVQSDARYRVYIAPRANRIVAIEPEGGV
jgi:hypothetical protein